MILYLDCAGGTGGDMLAAALCALSRALGRDGDDVVHDALVAAGIDPSVAAFARQPRGGLDALGFTVRDDPGFATFAELESTVDGSSLPPAVKERVTAAARRMAAAEAAAHGAPDTHLHELAGIDTAVDLIAVCSLVSSLAPDRVVAAPPALGSGWVASAHGRLPVPTPAVLALVTGMPTAGGADLGGGELTTPTGAALLAELADAFGPLPAGRVAAVGVGSGAREIEGRANVVRAVALEPSRPGRAGAFLGASASAPGDRAADPSGSFANPGASAADPDTGSATEAAEGLSGSVETLVLLETTIDDLSAEYSAAAADALRSAGARDAWLSPALMKKGRPGTTVHALVEPADVDRLAQLLFLETSTFGVRATEVRRLRLEERYESVEVDGEAVGVRLGYLNGRLLTASPEFDDCRHAGERLGRPARLVHERAQALARERFAES